MKKKLEEVELGLGKVMGERFLKIGVLIGFLNEEEKGNNDDGSEAISRGTGLYKDEREGEDRDYCSNPIFHALTLPHTFDWSSQCVTIHI